MKPGRLLLAAHTDPDLVLQIISLSPTQQTSQASTTQQVLEAAQQLCPAVVFIDADLPGLGGIETARLLVNQDPKVHILLVSDQVSSAEFFTGLLAGVIGYASKRAPIQEIMRGLQMVSRGMAFVEPAMNFKLIQEYRRLAKPAPCHAQRESQGKLSAREVEVLVKVAEGQTNLQIAQSLCISIKTVQSHRAHLMEKLEVHDRVALVKYALQKGLICLAT